MFGDLCICPVWNSADCSQIAMQTFSLVELSATSNCPNSTLRFQLEVLPAEPELAAVVFYRLKYKRADFHMYGFVPSLSFQLGRCSCRRNVVVRYRPRRVKQSSAGSTGDNLGHKSPLWLHSSWCEAPSPCVRSSAAGPSALPSPPSHTFHSELAHWERLFSRAKPGTKSDAKSENVAFFLCNHFLLSRGAGLRPANRTQAIT